MVSKTSLVGLSIITFFIFTFFSFMVAKEKMQQIDFATTVKLQDHITRRFDEDFSYFSLLGGVEVTVGLSILLSILSLVRLKVVRAFGYLLILPATFFELFGKVFVFHPAPPDFFHRNILSPELTKFYVHTNFSYPSGHMTRTIFLVTIFVVLALRLKSKILGLVVATLLVGYGVIMAVTRVYLGEHWLSDVIGGSLLGLSAGLLSSALIIGKRKVKID